MLRSWSSVYKFFCIGWATRIYDRDHVIAKPTLKHKKHFNANCRNDCKRFPKLTHVSASSFSFRTNLALDNRARRPTSGPRRDRVPKSCGRRSMNNLGYWALFCLRRDERKA